MENLNDKCAVDIDLINDKFKGVCRIKPEYIIDDHARVPSKNCNPENNKKSLTADDGDEPVAKKIKIDEDNLNLEITNDDNNKNDDEPPRKKTKFDKKKDKTGGQNKARPPPFKAPREKSLCSSLQDQTSDEPEKKCNSQKCSFMHDRLEYLKIKEPDIGPECYTFNLFGRCPRGTACRFGKNHIDKDGFNIINPDKIESLNNQKSMTKNRLPLPLQDILRKRKYNFSKSEKIIKESDAIKKAENDNKEIAEKRQKLETNITDNSDDNNIEKKMDTTDDDDKKLGAVIDYDLIKLRLSEKKKIDWKDKLFLSPLTTVGNLPFRRICKFYGADITCGEMALAPKILKGANEEWALVKKYDTEDIFGVQICGNNPGVLTRCAQLINQETDVDFIDLNLGCPIDLIYKQGAGSGMLNRSGILQTVVRSISDVIDVPLSIKTRMGVYQDKPIAHNLMPKFRDWGASMITIHGRSREQRYTKSADWKYIERCAAATNPIPIYGNGDIFSYDDYLKVRNDCPSIQGVTIGRGALIKPWIFKEIKEKTIIDVPTSERLDILKKYANYGLDHWGSDTKGVETTRKFMLEWMSFLHRYVPVGILEHPPQKMNDRPPYYRGRDEVETLLASSNCADWIKISEMFLGKVPDGFHFLPKHKANSWN